MVRGPLAFSASYLYKRLQRRGIGAVWHTFIPIHFSSSVTSAMPRFTSPPTPFQLSRLPRPFLLLILHDLHILRRDLLHGVQHILLHIIRQIPLDRDLLALPVRALRHARARRELLPEIFRHLFEVLAVVLEAGDDGHVFTLVALDALDVDFAGGALGFGGCGFGGAVTLLLEVGEGVGEGVGLVCKGW